MGANPVSVLIVDRHPIVGDALKAAVQSLLIVDQVDTVRSLAEARLSVSQHPVHLLILDHLAIGDRELTYLDSIKRLCAPLATLHFAADESVANIEATRDADYDGFVPKTASLPSLLTAIETVLSGARYFPTLASATLDGAQLPLTAPPIMLSQRRGQVLQCVLKGQSNAEIAAALGIAEGTVKSHIYQLMRAFDVNNRARLILRARGSGMG
ncbi:MAG: response regulator transcription factor [Pseudomonadota bacterium]